MIFYQLEFFSIKITYKILFLCPIDRNDHHPFFVIPISINRKLKQIRTFPRLFLVTTRPEIALPFPMFQVSRRINLYFLLECFGHNHHPPLSRFIIKDSRITKLRTTNIQHRITLIILKRFSIVAERQTLGLLFGNFFSNCINSYASILSKSGSILLVYDHRSRKIIHCDIFSRHSKRSHFLIMH